MMGVQSEVFTEEVRNIAQRRHLIPRFLSLSWSLQAGLALFAIGGVGDVVYHSFSGLSEKLGHALHLLTFVGMVFTMIAILVAANRTQF